MPQRNTLKLHRTFLHFKQHSVVKNGIKWDKAGWINPPIRGKEQLLIREYHISKFLCVDTDSFSNDLSQSRIYSNVQKANVYIAHEECKKNIQRFALSFASNKHHFARVAFKRQCLV